MRTRLYPNVHPGAASYGSVDPPREVLRTPAIGDIDGDLEPEIVDTAGEHVYAWNADGSTVPGFPVRLDPAFSRPQDRTRQNHVKRGFTASPVLGDLNDDGKLDIVIAALDEHLYAWDGSGNPLAGFPKLLQRPHDPGRRDHHDARRRRHHRRRQARHRLADAGVRRQPVRPGDPGRRRRRRLLQHPHELPGECAWRQRPRVRARPQRQHAPGWPTSPNGIVPDALPFVGPGVDHVMANVDSDPQLEAIGNVASGDVTATNATAPTRSHTTPSRRAASTSTSRR